MVIIVLLDPFLVDGLEELGQNELIQNRNLGVLINFEDIVVVEFILVLAYKVADVQGQLLDFLVSGPEPLLESVSFYVLAETVEWILLITSDPLVVSHNLLEALLIVFGKHILLLVVNRLDNLLFDDL